MTSPPFLHKASESVDRIGVRAKALWDKEGQKTDVNCQHECISIPVGPEAPHITSCIFKYDVKDDMIIEPSTTNNIDVEKVMSKRIILYDPKKGDSEATSVVPAAEASRSLTRRFQQRISVFVKYQVLRTH